MFIRAFGTRSPSILHRTRPLTRYITTKQAMETIKSTIAENFGGPAYSLAKPEHQFSLSETPDQSGKVAVVTGGSEGIGTVLQGYTEQSNVSVVDEFINLIVAQRTYEANSKIVKASDEMYQQANNLTR